MAEKFDQWAIVEIMGHQRFAGRVTEQAIGGANFVRVDVPASGDVPKFTKLFGPSSIYCISVVTEEVARAVVAQMRNVPVSAYDIRKQFSQLDQQHLDLDQEDEEFLNSI